MKTINSVSGGKSSAYLAKHYPADFNLFALVRINDCKFPDERIRLQVEDRIQKPFIGTAEDDLIIYTMLDLEQYLGQPIQWVSGITYDEVIAQKGGWLPNKLHRYCTTWMKLNPQFYWWAENIGEPVEMRIGYRANEGRRQNKTLAKLNKDGLLTFNGTFEKNARGQNKWEEIAWQKPSFPLIENNILKDKIVEYWKGKPVRFADYNNCVGCFHRHPLFLAKMYEQHPEKMEWFNQQEKIKINNNKKATWRSDVTYEQIKKFILQHEISFDEFSSCDSGGCTD